MILYQVPIYQHYWSCGISLHSVNEVPSLDPPLHIYTFFFVLLWTDLC